jgi:hypothetical protein
MSSELTPLELLEHELHKWQKALKKSKEAFDEGEIDQLTHETHVGNLEPKIQEFKLAIRVLNSYL